MTVVNELDDICIESALILSMTVVNELDDIESGDQWVETRKNEWI